MDKQQQYKGFTIFGKDDTAISFGELDHKRTKDNGDIKLMGYKLQITTTKDNFKTKQYLYLEKEELLNTLLILIGKKDKFKAIRNRKTSNTEKSIEIENKKGKISIIMDVRDEKNLYFSISNLYKMFLYKMILELLVKEMKRISGMNFTKNDILEMLDLLALDDTNNMEKMEKMDIGKKDDNSNNPQHYIYFTNNYNGKDYQNKITVDEKMYLGIKEIIETNKLTADNNKLFLEILVDKIKDQTNKDESKFLNLQNIQTLSIK